MAIKALFAVWGALANGNPNEAQAADVGGRLQQLFNEGATTVTINDNNFGDPAYGFESILRQRSTITAAFRTTPVRRARH